jgi:hypothetical protein
VCGVGTKQLSTTCMSFVQASKESCRQYTSCFRIGSAFVEQSSCSSGHSFIFIPFIHYIHSFIHSIHFSSLIPFIHSIHFNSLIPFIHSFTHSFHSFQFIHSIHSFHSFIHFNSFIHSFPNLTTGPLLLPKRVLHIVRATASCLKFPLFPPFLKVIQ